MNCLKEVLEKRGIKQTLMSATDANQALMCYLRLPRY